MARLVRFSCDYVPGGELLVNPDHVMLVLNDKRGTAGVTLFLADDREYTVNLKMIEVRRALDGN